jgi:hypothetical protein
MDMVCTPIYSFSALEWMCL